MTILDADREGQVPVRERAVSERPAVENPELITGWTPAEKAKYTGLKPQSVSTESPGSPSPRRAASINANADLIALVKSCAPIGSGKNTAETLFQS